MALPRIAILPDEVANRIAAGEVVERPASIVKELVENAIDAGASAVAIELEAGGKSLIRVADDGCGMGREDALLALDRHATSKIRTADDLARIGTCGFRGEALPSIASVSRLELVTAAADDPVGTRLVAAGGTVPAVEDVVRRPGTTVTVRSLFYNVPARRKFLRSARSESRASVEAALTLALARTALGFTVIADGRRVMEALPAGSLADRVAQLFGHRLASTLVPVDHAAGSILVRGLAQRPAQAAPSGRHVYLLVNGRPFRDPFLVRAAERGYRAAIAPGYRPTLILALEVTPEDVDVNVHPAKLEVRFRERYAVEAAVEEAVRRSLGDLVAAAPLLPGHFLPWEHPAAGRWPRTDSERGEPADGAIAPASPGPPGPLSPPRSPLSVAPALGAVAPGELFRSQSDESPLAATASEEGPQPFGARVVAQVHNAYLLVEAPDGLLIVDQHSAHERVLYDRAMRALASASDGAQKLLFPLTLDFPPEEIDAIEAFGDLLARLGYELEPFGGRAIIVHAVPTPHPRFDAERCLREVVSDLAGGRFGGLHNRLERVAATFACRAAIKAGQALARDEMVELVHRLFASDLPAHDVHGRPTIVQLPRVELERRFGRR